MKQALRITIFVLFLITGGVADGQMQIINQFLTAEDSLAASTANIGRKTYLGSYGEAKYQYNFTQGSGQATLQRLVLFVGHRFNKRISFFSEIEIENAVIEASRFTGEISIEQAFLRFGLNRDIYITAGLFLPRIGMMNENHLPTNYWSVDRPAVETLIIPTTWREIGIGLNGAIPKIPGFQYNLSILNGLNAARFSNGSGISEGRGLGAQAPSKNLAVTGAVSYTMNGIRAQISGYYGGAVGVSRRTADSLQLSTGIFGTPVVLVEGNIQYSGYGFYAKAIYAAFWVPDAYKVNRAYANNTPSSAWGAYGELGYNLFYPVKTIRSDRSLVPYVRFEILDLNQTVPENGIKTGTNRQMYLTAGVAYQPIRPVIIKLNYQWRHTDNPNPALIINPFPQQLPYQNANHILQIGVGYNF
ncbi:MAG: hypothetical protein U0T84_09065 [Chitinophagales bacterium]